MLHQYYPAPPAHNYQFELHKDITFSAAHFVPHQSAGKCQRLHGHTYTVNITVAGDQLDEAGFLVDFRTLKHMVEKQYDHTCLNNHPEFSSTTVNKLDYKMFPTTETLAYWLWTKIEDYLITLPNKPVCLQVLVRETPESYVIYRPRQV